MVRVTLRCECGGPLEITSGREHDHGFSESYRSPECGRRGGYEHPLVQPIDTSVLTDSEESETTEITTENPQHFATS